VIAWSFFFSLYLILDQIFELLTFLFQQLGDKLLLEIV